MKICSHINCNKLSYGQDYCSYHRVKKLLKIKNKKPNKVEKKDKRDTKFKSGNLNPNLKLTEEQVSFIKSSDIKASELSKRFGVSDSLIFKIRSGVRRKNEKNYL